MRKRRLYILLSASLIGIVIILGLIFLFRPQKTTPLETFKEDNHENLVEEAIRLKDIDKCEELIYEEDKDECHFFVKINNLLESGNSYNSCKDEFEVEVEVVFCSTFLGDVSSCDELKDKNIKKKCNLLKEFKKNYDIQNKDYCLSHPDMNYCFSLFGN